MYLIRRVVGMVKSPVEGHDIVLLKLEQPVVFSGKYIIKIIFPFPRKNIIKGLFKPKKRGVKTGTSRTVSTSYTIANVFWVN